MKTLRTDSHNVRDIFDQKASSPAVSLKGSVFTLPVLKISTDDISAVEQGIEKHLSTAINFFKNAPVVIDFSELNVELEEFDFKRLNKLLKKQLLFPVGVQNANTELNKSALEAGLATVNGQSPIRPKNPSTSETQTANRPAPPAAPNVVKTTELTGQNRVIHNPVRSGQRVYAKGGDLIVLAAVNAGAEIMADGNIHIYAPLRGRALAGVTGDTNTRIFCHSLEAELIAVAGNYRVFEEIIPDEIYKKPVQAYLDREHLIIVPIV